MMRTTSLVPGAAWTCAKVARRITSQHTLLLHRNPYSTAMSDISEDREAQDTPKLKAGDEAPHFTLPSTHGEESLEKHRGEWVVLYFYPKNFTPGCTTEACNFRDRRSDIDAVVLGVSPDSVDSHRRFAGEHELDFPLLADENNTTAIKYGAYGEKHVFGKTREGVIRSTFIISPEGVVADAMYGVKAEGHVDEVEKRLAQYKGG